MRRAMPSRSIPTPSRPSTERDDPGPIATSPKLRLSPSLEGVRDSARIGKRASDFRLIIDNPAPEDDQPRRVAIQLQ